MRTVLAAILAAVVTLSSAHAAEPAKKAPATADDVAAVKALVERIQAAYDTKDRSVVNVFAKDPDGVFIGTDAAEIWVGAETMKPAWERQLQALESSRSTVRDVRVKLLGSGKVAVATYLVDMEGKSGGEAFAMKGARLTTILEKRQGKWLVVSSHGSMPVAGQAVKY